MKGNHSKMYADQGSLANRTALDEPAKEAVYEQYRGGATAGSLAERFGRTEASIQRVIGQMRARRIFELPLEYMSSPEFVEPDAEQTILSPMPESAKTPRKARRPAGLLPYLASLYEVPLLTPEQEVHLFRKYNFLKFRAARLRSRLDRRRPRTRTMDQIERLYEEAIATKNRIIRANLRLVVSITKRHASDADRLLDLISEGNESLMRAVEKFDYTRGFKFSTYATWTIKKNSASTHAREMRHRDRFRTAQDERLVHEPEYRSDPQEQIRAQQTREAQIGKMLNRLSEGERRIIVRRFGIGSGEKPKLLREVAAEFGVSKERIRRLEMRALNKLREAAAMENVEAPEAA